MADEFLMPKLGLTMESGTILEWLVDDGTEVEQGSAVLVIETDKVESEVEASGSGLLHIVGEKGTPYPCGETIGWFLAPGEEAPAIVVPAAATNPVVTAAIAPASTATIDSNAAGGRLLASPNARRVAARRGVDLRRVVGTGPGGRIVSEDVISAPVGETVAASPAARQLAELLGIDVADVAAHGSEGRVSRDDVARHARERLAGSVIAAPSAPEMSLLQTPTSSIPLTGMRRTIATRMHDSLREMAQLTLTMDAVMDAVIEDRNNGRHETKPGFTDYVISAAAAALEEHPLINSQIAGGAVNLLPEINVGMAVAVDGGLVVPVVSRANERSLADLGAETTRLATAARDGALALADLEGGTFSVTALGMYGVDAFTPVINPPNAAILGVGRLRDDTRWEGDTPVRTTVLTLSLTWDHRAFDGAPAAEFAASVRDRLEQWGSAA